MRFVVRNGQRTWYGMDKRVVLERAAELERVAKVVGVTECAYRDRDMAQFYRKQASRMAE